MKFIIEIDCDNAAHQDGLTEALATNLQAVADNLAEHKFSGYLRDYNGNVVGRYYFAKGVN